MALSPKLLGTLLTTNQANAETTVNTFLKLLEAFTPQPNVVDRDLTAPPGSPNEGDVYVPASVATGDWAGEEDNFAIFLDSAWFFVVPTEGMTQWVADENVHEVYDGASWATV